jgi:hypothetical protein
MSDENDERDENDKNREREFRFRSQEGYQWLLRYGCFPLILAFVAAVAAILVARTTEGPSMFFSPQYLPLEIVEFEVNPAVITAGQIVTITWQVNGADGVTIEPEGSFPANGRLVRLPQQNTEYTLSATNRTRTVRAVREVVIIQPGEPSPTMTNTPPPTETTTPDTVTPTPTDTPTPTSVPREPVAFVPPSPTATPIPLWVACISNDANNTGWQLGESLPSGCSCLTGNWFCCAPDADTEGWQLVAGAILPLGERPTYPDFTNERPEAATAWTQRWAAHNYSTQFAELPSSSSTGLIVEQEPASQNQCLPFGSTLTVQVGATMTATEEIQQIPDLMVSNIAQPTRNCSTNTLAQVCFTEISFTVVNVGTGDAGPFSAIGVVDLGRPVAIGTQSSGLAAGQEQILTVTVPAGVSCFNPDCTVTVTVDNNNEVIESNEGNNMKENTWVS